MQLYEDTSRKQVYREGIGPALWDIPEQHAALTAETIASFAFEELLNGSNSEDEESDDGEVQGEEID